MAVEVPAWDDVDEEFRQVWRHRYQTARKAGCTRAEARELAEAEVEAATIRELAAHGCPGRLLAKILL